MTNPFRNDVPEPRWLTYGPDDDPTPDNYLPSEARQALRELGDDWLDPVDIKNLVAKVQEAGPDTTHADIFDEVYADWLKLTEQFRNIVDNLYDETVGDE